MEALLDPIFACELTPKLTQALVDIAFYIPPVKATIQERLLDMLSIVLCGEPFKPLGAPQPNTLNSLPVVPKDSKDPQAYEHRKAEIKLALNTLGSFDFSGTEVLFPSRYQLNLPPPRRFELTPGQPPPDSQSHKYGQGGRARNNSAFSSVKKTFGLSASDNPAHRRLQSPGSRLTSYFRQSCQGSGPTKS